MAGLVVTAADLNYAAGMASKKLFDVIEDLRRIQAYLADKNPADLEVLSGGMSADDAYLLKVAFDSAEIGALLSAADSLTLVIKLRGIGA